MSDRSKPKISIIIPVYNVEKYLERCIYSILNQTMHDIEIILVDDGSPDNCPEMCDGYARMDNRVKVIHKKNQGLGLARNSGLEVACGEYIAFVDSDDYIALDAFKEMYEYAKINYADTCLAGYYKDYGKDRIVRITHPLAGLCIAREEIMKDLIPSIIGSDSYGNGQSNMSMSLGIYSQELIKKHQLKCFSEREYISEDLIFNLYYFYHSQKVVISDKEYYFYCHNAGSLSKSYREDRFEKSIIIYNKLLKLIEDMGIKEYALERVYSDFIARVRFCLILEGKTADMNNLFSKIQLMRSICNSEEVQKTLKVFKWRKLPLKQKMFSFLMLHKSAIIIYLLLKFRDIYTH